MISLKAFDHFQTSDEAAQTINAISQRKLNDKVREFLKLNLPKSKKSYHLIVLDPQLAKEYHYI